LPVFTIFAGPNGAGKSSIIRRVDFAGRGNLLEADAIALRIHPANPGQVATAAGREVLLRTRGYLAAGQDFGVETTLSGASIIRAIKQAITRGFFVRLVYICLESPEQCIQRVHERVAQGGHNVPDEDVRRRYARSLVNLKQVTKIANETLVYDNSGPEPVLVLEVRSGRVTTEVKELPVWARNLLDAVS
jgi:predicted ABC-type ATPase